MIYETGFLLPSKAQKKALKQVADDTFTAAIPNDFGVLPMPDGWEMCEGSGTALRLKSVEPHTDPFAGIGKEPKKCRCIFWLVDQGKKQYPGVFYLQVGNDYKQLYEGRYVIFDDRKVHSVVAESFWRGVAYQIKPTKKVKK